MSRRVIPAAAVAAAAAIVAAGCASAGATGLAADNGAASVLPANTVVFVAVNTNVDSSQWHGLAKPFLAQYQTYAPALGDELDVALLPGKQIVALTKPKDATKLVALAKQDKALTRSIDGWTAIAKTSAALDAVAAAKTHLADSPAFTQAVGRLQGNALVRIYASGDQAAQLLQSIPGQLQTTTAPGGIRFRYRPSAQSRGPYAATTQFKWAVATLTSESKGVRLQAVLETGGLAASGTPRYIIHPTAPYRAALLDEIPAGVLAVADFNVPAGMFELNGLPKPFAKLLGSSKDTALLPNELDMLLGGETAIYVRPGAPLPEVTLVTQPPSDTAAASQALDSILAALPANSMLKGIKLYRATIGGQLVVSTSQAGIDAFRGGGAKLADDTAFQQASKDAGMGDETSGFVYANVGDALPFLQLAGVKLPQNLPNLGSFLAFSSGTDSEQTFNAFLAVG